MGNQTKHKQIDICDSANSNLVHIEDAITHEQIATFNKGSKKEKEANALYAMTAWNCHEELLETLGEALVDLENFKTTMTTDGSRVSHDSEHELVDKIRAVIAKATTGETL